MPNVIVADNDVVIRGLLRSLLVSIGQTVFLASCGEETIACATDIRADLVLLDLNMPRLNGLLVCEKLRHMLAYRNTPIVMLSGHDGERARHAATRVGATMFLGKPFQPALLLQALSPYLGIDVTAQKVLSRAATRAQAIAPLVGRAFERTGAAMEWDRPELPLPLAQPNASMRTNPPRRPVT
jgi:CheY-like chemotaxis protein